MKISGNKEFWWVSKNIVVLLESLRISLRMNLLDFENKGFKIECNNLEC